jgi:hypothetical protein
MTLAATATATSRNWIWVAQRLRLLGRAADCFVVAVAIAVAVIVTALRSILPDAVLTSPPAAQRGRSCAPAALTRSLGRPLISRILRSSSDGKVLGGVGANPAHAQLHRFTISQCLRYR